MNSPMTIKIMFSGKNIFFKEMLEPGTSFFNVCFEFQYVFRFGFFFPGVKIVSRLPTSAVYILTPGYQFVQSGFNCRENLRPETGCFRYYTAGLCFSLPFMF